MQVAVNISHGNSEIFYYPPGDKNSEHDYLSDDNPKTDSLLNVSSSEDKLNRDGILKLADQRSTDNAIALFAIRVIKRSLSAAQFYARMMGTGAKPVNIFIRWPTEFKTKQDLQAAAKEYPSLLANTKSALPDKDIVIPSSEALPFPLACSESAKKYITSAFERALLVISLDQTQDKKQKEIIFFRLRALRPEKVATGWVVEFEVMPAPLVSASDESIFADVFESLDEKKEEPEVK